MYCKYYKCVAINVKKQETDITFRMVSCVSAGAITHSVLQNTSTETWKRHISVTFACVSATFNWDKHFFFTLAETWRKHEQKVVRFRCIRSDGNASQRQETASGNTGYQSCFQNGLTCFTCDVSVYGFLEFRPVCTIDLTQTKKMWNCA